MMEEFLLKVKDTELTCRKYGSGGEPLVMIHGACVDADFFCETAEILSAFYTVYTYDRRGYGRNPEVEAHDFDVQAEDAKKLIDYIGVPCHVIAHSAGTIIGIKLAIKYPQRIRTIILYEPIAICLVTEHTDYMETMEQIQRKRMEQEYIKALYKFLPLMGKTDKRAREATEEEISHVMKNHLCFMKEEFEELNDMELNLQKTSVPTVVGIGELSRDTVREEMACKTAQILQGDLLYFPGGHNCPFDLPREFSYLVRGILENNRC